MRRVLILAGSVLIASACSLLVSFDGEGQRCAAGGECLAGYVCVDGTCRHVSDVTGADSGTDPEADARPGHAFFEALLSTDQVDPMTTLGLPGPSGWGRFEYDYGASTLRWSVDHDAGQTLYAVLHSGHPCASGPVWQGDAGFGTNQITGSAPVSDAGALIEALTRGHLYVALYDSTGIEVIRGHIVEPGGRIYVAPFAYFDSLLGAWVNVRGGFVASADAGTLYYDVTLDTKIEIADAGIHDSAGSLLQDTPWIKTYDKRYSTGVIAPLRDDVFQTLEADQGYYELDTAAAQAATGWIWKVK
jgi:hypothetical protein